jgi:hypothetical protein
MTFRALPFARFMIFQCTYIFQALLDVEGYSLVCVDFVVLAVE